MNTILKNIHRLCSLVLLIFILTACNSDRQNYNESGDALLYLTVKAARSSINEDIIYWEDRVDELRMIVFNAGDGEVSFNQKLYFPDGFDERSNAVQLTPGTYDFYFIANETVYPGNFVTALEDITNKSEFNTDIRFLDIAYDPDFLPDGTTPGGRFLMSAIYEDITIISGGTETNPLPLPIPTAKVDLIRSLAKVDVVFRKRVSGSNVPENTISSVQLLNVAASFSVPPVDEYYDGTTASSQLASLTGFDYSADSIGTVTFYIPEFLVPQNGTTYTELHINNKVYPIQSDAGKLGLLEQRRVTPALSDNTVIRNYHYIINAYINPEGGIQLRIYVEPWRKDTYIYIFQGDQQVIIPPVEPTDSSIIIPTECGRVEILSENEFLSQGLQGAYNDVVNYYDPEIQGPTIYKGDPPYYCEKKYGRGWRLINSCELLSFLAAFDMAYNIWMSNTWEAAQYDMPYYPVQFRQAAQMLLEKLTGKDLSGTVFYNVNNWADEMDDQKLGIIDQYFTPGDVMLRIMDFPNGWPYEAPPGTDLDWFYNEATIQVKPFWYGSDQYISLANRDNWDDVLYGEFERYDYSSTVSRCVRTVE